MYQDKKVKHTFKSADFVTDNPDRIRCKTPVIIRSRMEHINHGYFRNLNALMT